MLLLKSKLTKMSSYINFVFSCSHVHARCVSDKLHNSTRKSALSTHMRIANGQRLCSSWPSTPRIPSATHLVKFRLISAGALSKQTSHPSLSSSSSTSMASTIMSKPQTAKDSRVLTLLHPCTNSQHSVFHVPFIDALAHIDVHFK